MNPSYYRISLDVHDATSQLSFPIKVGDTSRRLLITLMDNGVPYQITEDCYAVFTAKRGGKQLLSNDCTISKNMIIYDISEQTSASAGRLDCEITLFGSNSEQLTSPRFTIIVYATTGSEVGEEIVESNEFKSLTRLISDANALIKEVETRLANGEFVGAKIIKTEHVDTDENGGYVYEQTFNDGSTAQFIAPKGEKGDTGYSGDALYRHFISIYGQYGDYEVRICFDIISWDETALTSYSDLVDFLINVYGVNTPIMCTGYIKNYDVYYAPLLVRCSLSNIGVTIPTTGGVEEIFPFDDFSVDLTDNVYNL